MRAVGHRAVSRTGGWARTIGPCVGAMLVLLIYSVALAHTTLISSEPAAGAQLTESPPRIRLVFSEPIEPRLGQISVAGSDGVAKPLLAAGDPRDVHALIAPVDSLTAGSYRIAWRVVSADGHAVAGSLVFTIAALGIPPDSIPAPPPPAAATDAGNTTASDDTARDATPTWGPTIAGAPLVASILRGLAVGSLMGACGLLLFLGLPVGGGAAPRRPARLALRLSVLAPLLLGAHLAAWMINVTPGHSINAATLSATLTTRVGQVELWRLGFALLAMWAIVLAKRPRLAFLFTVAALAVSGATGHSAAITPLWATPAKALHLLAAAAWLGGLLWLLLLHWEDDHSRCVAEAGRVSSIALIAVMVVAVSGAVQAFLFLPSPADLVRSTYGVLTLAKLAGLGALVAFGAHHRHRVLPRLADPRAIDAFRPSLSREIAVMAALVLLGGFLAYVPPPPGDDAPVTRGSRQ